MDKYLVFRTGEHSCGFGNQLRSLVGWYVLAEILDRKFVIEGTLVKSALDSPYSDEHITLPAGLTEKSCAPSALPATSPADQPQRELAKTTNFHNLEEDVLICESCEPILNHLYQNPYHQEAFKQVCSRHLALYPQTYGKKRPRTWRHFKNSLFSELFKGPTPLYSDITYKHFTPPAEPYISVQFRGFFDAQWTALPKLDKFIQDFPEAQKKRPDIKTVFVTSDDIGIAHYISLKIKSQNPSLNILVTKWPQCHACGNYNIRHSNFSANKATVRNNLLSIKDWLILGNSSLIYSAESSFSDSASEVFSTPHYLVSSGPKGRGEGAFTSYEK